MDLTPGSLRETAKKEVKTLSRRLMLTIMAAFTIVGGAGCMNSENKVIVHLEKKYNQKFSVEGVKKGSKMLAQMYGKDKLTVHPEGNPDLVFLAQEDAKDKDVNNDNYVVAKWAEELKAELEPEIEEKLPKGSPYKVLLQISPRKYDASMASMPFDEYMKDEKDFRVVIVAAIKTEGEPQVSRYSQNLYDLFGVAKSVGSKRYTISVGFVDQSEDVSDYIRTSLINNIPWSNLEANLYGYVNIDEEFDGENPSAGADENLLLQSPEDVSKHYVPIEE